MPDQSARTEPVARTRPTRAGASRSRERASRSGSGRAGRPRRLRMLGGTEGNERLTTLTGLVLIVLLAVLGVTIVRIGQLLWLHLFLGLVLIGPVLLKLASTGYRFMRYYTGDPTYRRKGPPAPALRGLAPLVVLSTVAVFATGVALLALGPQSRGLLVLAHKASFFAWIAVTALHVLGHLPEIVRLLARARRSRQEILALHAAHAPRPRGAHPAGRAPLATQPAGGRQRGASMVVALGAGLLLAVALLGQFAAWTH